MSILKVSKLGNPVLRRVADPVPPAEISTPEFQRLIDDMIETMREYEGVGLAAPQIHLSRRVAVIESDNNARYPGKPPIPLRVLINPVVVSIAQEQQSGWEGCLSVDNLRGLVPRARQITVRALDREGREETIEAKGFLAVVLQHELDHLDGKVYLDRMKDLSTLSHMREFYRHWYPEQ